MSPESPGSVPPPPRAERPPRHDFSGIPVAEGVRPDAGPAQTYDTVAGLTAPDPDFDPTKRIRVTGEALEFLRRGGGMASISPDAVKPEPASDSQDPAPFGRQTAADLMRPTDGGAVRVSLDELAAAYDQSGSPELADKVRANAAGRQPETRPVTSFSSLESEAWKLEQAGDMTGAEKLRQEMAQAASKDPLVREPSRVWSGDTPSQQRARGAMTTATTKGEVTATLHEFARERLNELTGTEPASAPSQIVSEAQTAAAGPVDELDRRVDKAFASPEHPDITGEASPSEVGIRGLKRVINAFKRNR